MTTSNSVCKDDKLPLDWTRVVRNKKMKQTVTQTAESSLCSSLFSGNNGVASCSCRSPTEDFLIEASQQQRVIKGIGIFCLHDIDATWFQGYFFPEATNTTKPIGLLATPREMDECVQCADGGYREFDLTVYLSTKKQVVPIICTGGEMMRIRPMSLSKVNIAFDAIIVYTGDKTIPYLENNFSSLVTKQRNLLLQQQEHASEVDEIQQLSALDLLPDCAIVRREMLLTSSISL